MSSSSVVLASASPRRAELLLSAGLQFEVMTSNVAEELLPPETPEDYVIRLARAKAADVASRCGGSFVIGADTIVVCDGEIMEKPKDAADAERMLKKLSGISHEVMTGYAIHDKEQRDAISNVIKTKVYFKHLYDEEIKAYIASGCPFDKAGAYAIQGGAAYMVRKIEGSYTNVVGLPLCEVVEALRTMGAIRYDNFKIR